MLVNENVGKKLLLPIGILFLAALFCIVLVGMKSISGSYFPTKKSSPYSDVKTVQLGDPTTLGGITFSIGDISGLGSETPTNTDNSQFSHLKTNGQYIMLPLIINSSLLKATVIFIKKVSITDQEGRNYTPIGYHWAGDTTTSYFSGEQGIVLNPDIDSKSGLLFEVSKDSKSYILNVDYTTEY